MLNAREADALSAAIDGEHGCRLRNGDRQFAIRDTLAIPAVTEIAMEDRIRRLVESVLTADCVAVRAIVFDKVAGANWKVPFHQDLTIEVRERREQPGFGPWSIKKGAHCVQPPAEILRSMVAVRLHLDEALAENGPLRVLPGSHAHGRLSPVQIDLFRKTTLEVQCLMAKGDALLIRPLLFHASSAATRVGHRRVIHIDFGPRTLPGDLEWHRAI